ncbi:MULTISPECIES: BON domain-containing protein [Rubrivivax]|uniref:BON domain-containing protein n=1 Tax=Rubrivivax benzoatilyticus TaxID=316997 RepID=A0ABX0HWS5_9BURK|nr:MULTISPECIES: BON domain-containing protein [Rubrivivax]MCD0421494.1 BON domain-containing protein [Rubrivivax sp. JA1024]EGJ12458.1 putative lipoprotein [Rubrivivax benzoatilyticus JA2 = ATCC BAA-35]MCC9597640.1 BON domain-containing protein [Rubrivivax sp. JA1055]MCC9646102.1 BON domain-containing protein [Rubrivivax sp. JA1029]NHK98247.1 BON domain-containing protein [Rubrivivax benzoatilyticus]
MNTIRNTLAATITAVAALVVLPGCAVTRDQSTVGEYIDDSAITTAVKARFVEDKTVDASAISVETLRGEVMLSGFAKSGTEKERAETLARSVKGVKQVKNKLEVRG